MSEEWPEDQRAQWRGGQKGVGPPNRDSEGGSKTHRGALNRGGRRSDCSFKGENSVGWGAKAGAGIQVRLTVLWTRVVATGVVRFCMCFADTINWELARVSCL